jgi:hypothetical protein
MIGVVTSSDVRSLVQPPGDDAEELVADNEWLMMEERRRKNLTHQI